MDQEIVKELCDSKPVGLPPGERPVFDLLNAPLQLLEGEGILRGARWLRESSTVAVVLDPPFGELHRRAVAHSFLPPVDTSKASLPCTHRVLHFGLKCDVRRESAASAPSNGLVAFLVHCDPLVQISNVYGNSPVATDRADLATAYHVAYGVLACARG